MSTPYRTLKECQGPNSAGSWLLQGQGQPYVHLFYVTGSPGPAGRAGMPGPAGPIGLKGDNISAGELRPKGDPGPPGEQLGVKCRCLQVVSCVRTWQ